MDFESVQRETVPAELTPQRQKYKYVVDSSFEYYLSTSLLNLIHQSKTNLQHAPPGPRCVRPGPHGQHYNRLSYSSPDTSYS